MGFLTDEETFFDITVCDIGLGITSAGFCIIIGGLLSFETIREFSAAVAFASITGVFSITPGAFATIEVVDGTMTEGLLGFASIVVC